MRARSGSRRRRACSARPTSRCAAAYDLAMLDLDGVVYVGGDAVPGAPEHLAAARDGRDAAGVHHQQRLPPARAGGRAPARARRRGGAPSDVVTSAQAAARVLRRPVRRRRPGGLPGRRGPASRRCSRRGPGAGRRRGRRGGGRDRLRAGGALGATSCGPRCGSATGCRGWPATPTRRSRPRSASRPGTASRWRCCAGSPGSSPVVAGKPERPLLDETVRRVGGERPLMVGDRLDTDIEGARRAGLDSLLVLTGVTGLAELVAAPARGAADVRRARPRRPAASRTRRPSRRTAARRLGGWRAEVARRPAAGRRRRRDAATGGGWSRPRPGRTSTRPGSRWTCPASSAPVAVASGHD